MDTLLYFFARSLIALLQALPLVWVARFGRAGGALAYWLDKRHRRVTLKNLTMCFGNEKIAGRNPHHRQRKFPAHRRMLRLRYENRRDEFC
ncbi:MAG: hypothetical protein WDM76_19670 [Limisphaerales bacterium]